jgi:hypothetical protein
MKTTPKLVASFLTLLAACALHAADPKPANRVVSILDVQTDDPVGYAVWMKRYNEIAKAKLGIDNYTRIYQSYFDSRQPGYVRVVTTAANVAELMKNAQALDADPAILENRERVSFIRKRGARVLYQTVRTDGPSPSGANNYNTLAVLSDEAAYLKAIDDLRTIFDSNGFKDTKITVMRVLAGRTDHSHRITINLPSPERLAAWLDFVATSPQAQTWLASTAKFRTVVANTTSREITK